MSAFPCLDLDDAEKATSCLVDAERVLTHPCTSYAALRAVGARCESLKGPDAQILGGLMQAASHLLKTHQHARWRGLYVAHLDKALEDVLSSARWALRQARAGGEKPIPEAERQRIEREVRELRIADGAGEGFDYERDR